MCKAPVADVGAGRRRRGARVLRAAVRRQKREVVGHRQAAAEPTQRRARGPQPLEICFSLLFVCSCYFLICCLSYSYLFAGFLYVCIYIYIYIHTHFFYYYFISFANLVFYVFPPPLEAVGARRASPGGEALVCGRMGSAAKADKWLRIN